MEDKKLNEKESLALITQMINSSKKNMEIGQGNIMQRLQNIAKFRLWRIRIWCTAVRELPCWGREKLTGSF